MGLETGGGRAVGHGVLWYEGGMAWKSGRENACEDPFSLDSQHLFLTGFFEKGKAELC